MSWGGGVQEVLGLLQEINSMLGEVANKTQALEQESPKVEETAMTMQQATRILFRMNSIMSHMGLGTNIGAALSNLQRLVFMARMAQMSLNFLAMASPYGAIMGVAGFTSIAFTSIDMKIQDDVFAVGE